MYDTKHVVVEHKEPNTKRITTNTVLGKGLKENVRHAIEQTINVEEGEVIEIVYIYNDTFDEKFDIVKDIIVGVTNYRIFKIEDGRYDAQKINEIISIAHEKNGIFRWDKIICLLKKNKQNTFGIYHGDVCGYFCNYINEKLKKTT